MANNHIETPSIGEILQEEFMIPMGLSAYKLAQDIKVPVSRIQDILHNRRKITADTSLRLAKLFGVSDSYFLDMQNEGWWGQAPGRIGAAKTKIFFVGENLGTP